MLTNTFAPHVGGVARSVEAFARQYREKGHNVKVIAPEFPGMIANEKDVIRVPAYRRFNGSDFSVRLPIPIGLIDILTSFEPSVVHSHHPFMLGATAVRLAHHFKIPLIFTNHTMYEQYTHYVPGDSEAMKRFVIELSTGYANLCDHVIAPSESTAEVIQGRGVETPITVIPTGVQTEVFANGSGKRMRESMGIPENAFVVGHVGRLAPEKNLDFLARSVLGFIGDFENGHFLVAGEGPCTTSMQKIFDDAGLGGHLHFTGKVEGQQLIDSYKAMDLFVFASFTETQGMVLTEAMAAGVPVIAIDAPGAREVVIDHGNGFLLPTEDETTFTMAIRNYADMDETKRSKFINAALARADEFSIEACTDKALALYANVIEDGSSHLEIEETPWENALDHLATEWRLLTNAADAAGVAMNLKPSRSGGAHDRSH
jgi:glycosyltransferase involved in cell wall biosynthesis